MMGKHILLLLSAFSSNHLLAQLTPTCPPGQLPAETCANACVFCDINGYTGSTSGYNNIPQTLGCGCLYVDNDQWLAFVAGDTMATFSATCTGCVNNNGLQIAIYESCSEGAIDCDCGGQGNWNTVRRLQDVPLSPGTTYYLQIDGWSGDKCSFVLTVDPPTAAIAIPLGSNIDPIQGPDIICPGATVTFSVPPVANAGTYTWSVPAGWLINGQSSPQHLQAVDGGHSVKVKVGTNSGQICVTAANSCFPNGPSICKDILVGPAPVNVLPPVFVCQEDKPYLLPWGELVSTSGVFQKTLKSLYNCDSIVHQEVVIQQLIEKTLPEITLCQGDSIEICGTNYTSTGSFTHTCQNAQGCDSLINFSVSVLAPLAQINGAASLTCTTKSVLLTAAPSPSGTRFIWEDGNGQFLGDSAHFLATISGMYILTAILEGGGIMCQQSDTVLIEEHTTIPVISASGGILNCTIDTVHLDANTDVNTPTWHWSGPNGYNATIQQPAVTQPGVYTVTTTNQINGCTATTSVEVQSDTEPPGLILTGATLTCADTLAQINLISTTDAVTYMWTGPQGFLSFEASPEVSLSGIYTAIVTDTTNQCTSSSMVEVVQNDTLPGATATVNGTISCLTPVILLTGNSPSPGASYFWTGPGNFSSFIQNPTVNLAGTYSLWVKGSNGCTSITSVKVDGNINSPDVWASGGTLSCNNPALLLDGNSSTMGVSYTWTGPNGFMSAEQHPEVSDTGIYTVVVTALNYCTAETTVLVAGDFALPEVYAATDTITCWKPEVNLIAGSLTTGTTFQWTGPGAYIAFSDTSTTSISGNYTLVASGLNGCKTQSVLWVPIDTIPPGAAAKTDTLTCTTPSLNLIGTSNAANVNWNWNGPDNFVSNVQAPAVHLPGLYFLTVTDLNNGCTSVTSSVIEADQAVPIVTSDSGLLTCAQNSILLTGSANVPAHFEWSGPNGFGFTGSTPEISVPGQYILIAQSMENGCADTIFITIEQDITPPDATAQGGMLDCQSTQITLNGLSNTPGAVFSWTGPNNFSAMEPNPSVANPGQYLLHVTGPNGCHTIVSAEVFQNIDAPVVTLSGVDTLTCYHTSLTLVSDIQTPGASGMWSGPGALSSDSSHITISIPGTYIYSVIGPNGCVAAPAATILQDTTPPLSIVVQGGELNCAIPIFSIHAESSTSSSYQWSGPSGFMSAQQSPSVIEPGDYIVTLTGWVNGCSATATAVVTQDLSEPEISIQADSLTCLNSTVILQATSDIPDATFEWSGPDNFTAFEEDPFVNQPGIYTVVVTGLNGCSAQMSHLVYQNLVPPVVNVQSDTLNCSNPSGEIVILGSSDASFYTWSGPDNFTAAGDTAEVWISGVYTLLATGTNGCTSSVEVTIFADSIAPVVAASGGTITCQDTIITLSAVSDVAVNWQWTGPGNFTAQTPYTQTSQQGIYQVSGMASNGCIGTGFATVDTDTEVPALDIVLPDSLDCTQTQVLLEVLADTGTVYNFQWTSPNGFIVSGSNSPTAIVSEPGQYIVLITNIINGCSVQDTAFVVRNQDIPTDVQMNLRHVTCSGEKDGSVDVISVTGGTAPYVYAVDDLNFTAASYHPGLGGGLHSLTVQDNNGCRYTTWFQIEELEALLLDLGPDTTIHLGESIALTLDGAINDPSRVAEIQITPANLSLPATLTPLYTFIYQVILTDSGGCETQDSRLIVVRKERQVYIPNIFKPNSPDNGYLFIFGGADVQLINKFAIFDRWGNAVFEKRAFFPNDPTTGWDGKYRGQPLNPAVYVFYAEVLFIDGEVVVYKGDVTLIR